MLENSVNYKHAMELIQLAAKNLELAKEFLELTEARARVKRHVGWAVEDIHDLHKTLTNEMKKI